MWVSRKWDFDGGVSGSAISGMSGEGEFVMGGIGARQPAPLVMAGAGRSRTWRRGGGNCRCCVLSLCGIHTCVYDKWSRGCVCTMYTCTRGGCIAVGVTLHKYSRHSTSGPLTTTPRGVLSGPGDVVQKQVRQRQILNQVLQMCAALQQNTE